MQHAAQVCPNSMPAQLLRHVHSRASAKPHSTHTTAQHKHTATTPPNPKPQILNPSPTCRWIHSHLAGARHESCWEAEILAEGILEVDGPPADGRSAYEPLEFFPEPSEDEKAELERDASERRGRRLRSPLDLSAGRRCDLNPVCCIESQLIIIHHKGVCMG